MSTAADYFSNHARVRRFPWSLYHGPLEASLQAFLELVAQENAEALVLVVGCGLMQEFDQSPKTLSFLAVDIDERAVLRIQERGDPRLSARHIQPDTPLSTLGAFDAIYAKEVIEHIVSWRRYLRDLREALKVGGRVWLSTPNYGDPWLPVVEQTFLEVVARFSGFSRRDIHPSKFTKALLTEALWGAGLEEVCVEKVAFHLALCGSARRLR